MDHQKKIREQLRKGQIIPVVGAGVSSATAGLPGWKGLIENGLKIAEDLHYSSDKIFQAKEFLNKDKLTEAAKIVKKLLNAPDHPFANWINDVFKTPTIKSTELIESIQNLCQPIIATTNYDDLLRTTGSPQTDMALDWSQHEEIHTCLNNRSNFILHLHGLFTRPETPILGSDDYKKINKHTGYKTILNKLWMDKQFLFIGCSRDGVMDEDFMTVIKMMMKWFPRYQNEHYILMLDQEIGSDIHKELVKKCNVHLVPYGHDHDQLPNFINKLNPNADEIVKRYRERKEKAFKGIKAILDAQPELEINEDVKDFIKDSLGLPYYWVANDKIQIFMDALEKYNSAIQKKQDKLVNLQIMLRSLINLNDLKRNIDLWKNSNQSTTLLNNNEYIDLGILSWKLLSNLPTEVLQDIKIRSYNTIHHSFYSNYLLQFYEKAKNWKKNSGKLEDLDGNLYFFENLYRIMRSLLGVIQLDVNELYQEKLSAKIATELPNEFILLVHLKRLTIVKSGNIQDMIAELPWDESLEFIDAEVIRYNTSRIVIGFNSLYCFTWNPIDEISASNFFKAQNNEKIMDLKILEQGKHVVVEIYTSKRKITMVNFSDSSEIQLKDRFGDYVRIKSTSKNYCIGYVSMSYKDNCVFELSPLGEYIAKTTTVNLWEQLKEIPEIFVEYKEYIKQENLTCEKEDYIYPYIEDLSLTKINWIKIELLALRIRFGFGSSNSTAIFLINPSIGFDKPVLKIYFPHKICFTFDTIVHKNKVDLIAGYLDFNEVGNLIQYFESIQDSQLIIAQDQPGIIPQEYLTRRKIRDMFYASFSSENRAFVIEEGKILHDIDISTLKTTDIEFEENLKYIHYYS